MDWWVYIVLWVIIVPVVLKHLFERKKIKEVRKKDWKKDTVYLYQFPRPKTVPNLSPFCLKVETFLKANKIPYEVCPSATIRSQYGMVPFIELNGEQIADSQIILYRLSEHFNVKPVSLPNDGAIARAVERMVDSHTFLVLRHFIVAENAGDFFKMVLQNMRCPDWLVPVCGPIVGFLLRGKVVKRIAAGVGLMSNENYKEILRKDFDALQTLLDQQKFFGGEHVTTTDCSVFGHLATTLYILHDSYAKELLKEQYPALVKYCDRVKEAVFGNEFAST